MVIIAERIHLFPYRTQKLSSPAPKVLGGKLPGRVGSSHVKSSSIYARAFLYENINIRLVLRRTKKKTVGYL